MAGACMLQPGVNILVVHFDEKVTERLSWPPHVRKLAVGVLHKRAAGSSAESDSQHLSHSGPAQKIDRWRIHAMVYRVH